MFKFKYHLVQDKSNIKNCLASGIISTSFGKLEEKLFLIGPEIKTRYLWCTWYNEINSPYTYDKISFIAYPF